MPGISKKKVILEKTRIFAKFGGAKFGGVDILASFKLSYVTPENHKIGKSGWWKLGRKSGVWRPKTGFENFSLNEN